MIRVENLHKSHRSAGRDLAVLRGVSCLIPTGSFCFVIGPSGSGKSTLLYLMGALDEPTSGEIFINERSLTKMSGQEKDQLRREQIGFVFQSFNLLSNLNAVDNVLVPFLPLGTSAARHQDAIDLLKQVGLGDRLDHRPSQLSGGEQQRVAIARALLKRPSLILADEPTGELDSENGAAIFEVLRKMSAERGVTIVTVTHDQRYLRPDDQVLEIRDGRIQT